MSRLQQKVDLRGRNISFDRYYTSIPCAQFLLSRGITCIGTLQTNRKGLPIEIKSTAGRDPLSYRVYWNADETDMTLHSYVVKPKSSSLRNVLLLSTMPPFLGVTVDDGKNKPQIYKLYDFSKGGTDIIDARMAKYSSSSKSRKWTLTVLAYMMDVARVNSQTIWSFNNDQNPRTSNSFLFGYELSKQLVLPLIERRAVPPLVGIPISVQSKMSVMLGRPIHSISNPVPSPSGFPYPSKVPEKRCCIDCVEEIMGSGRDVRKRKNALTRLSSQCQKCKRPVCPKHFVLVCNSCAMSL